MSAPSCRIPPETADAVKALADSLYPDGRVEIVFHPQCFLTEGHFAGPDAARADAFVEIANDERFDAFWFGRGGYGSGRLLETVLPRLNAAARRKTYLGYSDAANMLAALYAAGFKHVFHGPMPQDLTRPGGEAAVVRSLAWLVDRDRASLEPSVGEAPTLAFNMAILSQLIGTPWQPPMDGHVLMLEEVSEHMYRIDRFMFHITSNPGVRRAAGVRLGRCSLVPPNDPDFVHEEEAVVRYWCERSGLAYLGRADIGHDSHNKVVPFGRL